MIQITANRSPTKASDPAQDKKTFRTDCRNIHASALSKILEGSPIKYKIDWAICCCVSGAENQRENKSI